MQNQSSDFLRNKDNKVLVDSFLDRWLQRISLTTESIPEIMVRALIRENKEEFLSDCFFTESSLKPQQVFDLLIVEALKRQKKKDEVEHSCSYTSENVKPALDYYDNRRDRFSSKELVPYKGQFGVY